jgi:hypothetical protein
MGPVTIVVRMVKKLRDADEKRCYGLFIPKGPSKATIWLDSKAPRSTLHHEFLHAAEHYFGIFSNDSEELRVTVTELLWEQVKAGRKARR